MSKNSAALKRLGCGCSVVAVLSVVALIVALALFVVRQPQRDGQQPVEIPPIAAPPLAADTDLNNWAAQLATAVGIGSTALRAYGNAELVASEKWPECHLSWATVAGIGFVETRHGTYTGAIFGGAHLDENGVATPPIYGPRLDGAPGFAEISDTDAGQLDGDSEYDRAMGPLQFIPKTWQAMGLDGNRDGKLDPQQIDDAAAAAAQLLCFGGRDLATSAGWKAAVNNYNPSSSYLNDVAQAAQRYALAATPPAGESDTASRP